MEPEDASSDPADVSAMNSAAEAPDTQLLSASRETPATLDAFLAQVERRAFRMAEMQLRQREDAMDAVQDAMLRLVKHYRDKPATEWAPLFWGILRRRIVDLQRVRDGLAQLVESCPGHGAPEHCPILQALIGEEGLA